MLFTSVVFLSCFLPLCLVSFFLLGRKNFILLAWSLLFYFYGEGWHIVLLLVSAGAAYVHGLSLLYLDKKYAKQTTLLTIAFQLILLGYFKYSQFIVEGVFQFTNNDITWPLLPLGISFYVFQAISYSIDVYRGHSHPTKNLTAVLTYITLFPQLIAGPIVRYNAVARALESRRITMRHITNGGFLFVIGLAQKVLIADKLALPADTFFGADPELMGTYSSWLGALFYTGQIYFDFAGYSNMAIGLGLVFGLKFPKNFNFPYIALSITTFWRRWHMSLTRWFRDYLYIPLGGNRGGQFYTYRNLFLVFLISGLWHGASWTFVLWGVYHGVFLVVERLGFGKVLKTFPKSLAWFYTFITVVVGWVLFRAENMTQFTDFMSRMFVPTVSDTALIHQSVSLDGWIALGLGALMSTGLFAAPIIGRLRTSSFGREIVWIFSVVLFLLCYVEVTGSTYSPFIYFRF